MSSFNFFTFKDSDAIILKNVLPYVVAGVFITSDTLKYVIVRLSQEKK